MSKPARFVALRTTPDGASEEIARGARITCVRRTIKALEEIAERHGWEALRDAYQLVWSNSATHQARVILGDGYAVGRPHIATYQVKEQA